MLFIQYPPCTTCQKAKKWLDEHGRSYTDRHIKAQNESDASLPAIFNEYMHLSWDDPFASRTEALAPAMPIAMPKMDPTVFKVKLIMLAFSVILFS